MDEESLNPGYDSKANSLSRAAASKPGRASSQHSDTPRAGAPRERRKRRRALISAPIRVRAVHLADPPSSHDKRPGEAVLGDQDDISTTLDVSRNGVLFVSSMPTFVAGTEVAVTLPYTKSPEVVLAEKPGRIVRVTEMADGRRSVAIALGPSRERVEHDACGTQAPLDRKKPAVLIVDADATIRDSLKVYLGAEGYAVFAVSCAAEAHEILKLLTPALLIAEIEGDDLPGYELCAHCKATPQLKAVPVVLLTRSAYPSDYANAHTLGAVVCMAKPYRQERLGHIVRLLAPTDDHKQVVEMRPIDPSRRCRGPWPKTKKNGLSICDSVEHRPPWQVWGWQG